MLQAELLEGESFARDLDPNPARHTRALMQALLETSDLKDRLACGGFRRAAE
jgi:hypothetical protein